MHIPDGYLSPSTCTTLYAGATAGWYSAMRRLKRRLFSRVVPLVSVFAAFSFVVMMFNLPLPGGTTAHALGVTIAAIVLGPSEAILAVSIALVLQALFFGDGGISTLGANCFNMAIAGSLVAYASYKLFAARASIDAPRRIIAAGVAGYLAANAAALLAAVEFGIQPIFFHDAHGTPLYAPYPLKIAIPAMMIGHLTFAGVAEAVLTAGAVAYLRIADPALLARTAGEKPKSAEVLEVAAERKSVRSLWITVSLLMLLTPLGILAAGSAWGEWSPSALPNYATGVQYGTVGHAQPSKIPSGLESLSHLWTAPFPGYAPPWIRSRKFGYLLSAMFATGLLMAVSLLLQKVAERHRIGYSG